MKIEVNEKQNVEFKIKLQDINGVPINPANAALIFRLKKVIGGTNLIEYLLSDNGHYSFGVYTAELPWTALSEVKVGSYHYSVSKEKNGIVEVLEAGALVLHPKNYLKYEPDPKCCSIVPPYDPCRYVGNGPGEDHWHNNPNLINSDGKIWVSLNGDPKQLNFTDVGDGEVDMELLNHE